MRFLFRVTILFTLLILSGRICNAQLKSDSLQVGEVHGIVRDSVHNYVLDVASVAIYRESDSALVSYQLTNSFGAFHFKKMPVGTPLKIMVSYVGYKTFKRMFTISEKNKIIDLKELIINRKTTELQEVVISYVPPIRMNQDTLEFNADAFILDKNAVVEDLLRKLPRLTIWGDGSITVNGKPVKQVLVNGKPFFGGDFNVAIQNIPKNAVDKIQVYKEQQNKKNPLDSITSINIKLKKDKAFGLFGKLSSGYGTQTRTEGSADFNLFNKHTQFSLVGAANNVNKIADNANTLLRNSTYKNTGVNIEYQPDFRLLGVNQSTAGGAVLRHDFISSANYNNASFLTADYFIKSNRNTVEANSKIVSTIRADSTQTQQVDSQNKNDISDQNLNVKYERRKSYFQLNAATNFHTTANDLESSSQTDLYGTSGDLKSKNNLIRTANTSGKDMSLNIDFNREKPITKMNSLPGNLSVGYRLKLGNRSTNGSDVSLFTSVSNSAQNQQLNRLNDRKYNDAGHHLTLGLGNFSGLLFGYKGLFGIGLSLGNTADFNTHKEDNQVKNIDTAGLTQVNPYLTNTSKVTVFSEQPALHLSKIFYNELANRYKKVISIAVSLQEQFYYQKNSSSHAFQNFERNYLKFIPSASISYQNDQYGDLTDDFTLSFLTVADYPTVNQLQPLVDSTNVYNIVLGNPKLKASKEHRVSFKMEHASHRMKNTFRYSAEITAGLINNSLVDSILIDSIGRSKHYTVNASGSRYINLTGALNKAFKIKQHQLQLQFLPSLGLYNNPVYINNVLNISNTITSNNKLSLFYTLSDWWAVNFTESFLFYSSKQRGANELKFSNVTMSTIFGTTVNFTKRVSLGSNASYNSASSTGARAARYTIWNANAVCRMLNGNNLELRVAALDLLRQNTGIINTGFNNTITRGTSNVLQQYFMISLAYYPRQFGSKGKTKN